MMRASLAQQIEKLFESNDRALIRSLSTPSTHGDMLSEAWLFRQENPSNSIAALKRHLLSLSLNDQRAGGKRGPGWALRLDDDADGMLHDRVGAPPEVGQEDWCGSELDDIPSIKELAKRFGRSPRRVQLLLAAQVARVAVQRDLFAGGEAHG